MPSSHQSEARSDSTRDRFLLLSSMSNLAGLDRDALHTLAEHTTLKRFASGEQLLHAGQDKQVTYLLTRGRVAVTHHGQFMTEFTAPGVVGLLAVLCGDAKPLQATCEEDVEALELPVLLLLDAFEDNFSALHNSLRNVALRLLRHRGGLPASAGSSHRPSTPPRAPAPEPTPVELILRISQQGIFADANIDAVIDMTRIMHQQQYAAGELLWEANSDSSEFLLVTAGQVRCSNSAGEVLVGPGFVLGVLDAIAASERSFSARAHTELVVQRVDREQFLGILETHFDLARRLLGVLAAQALEQFREDHTGRG